MNNTQKRKVKKLLNFYGRQITVRHAIYIVLNTYLKFEHGHN